MWSAGLVYGVLYANVLVGPLDLVLMSGIAPRAAFDYWWLAEAVENGIQIGICLEGQSPARAIISHCFWYEISGRPRGSSNL